MELKKATKEQQDIAAQLPGFIPLNATIENNELIVRDPEAAFEYGDASKKIFSWPMDKPWIYGCSKIFGQQPGAKPVGHECTKFVDGAICLNKEICTLRKKLQAVNDEIDNVVLNKKSTNDQRNAGKKTIAKLSHIMVLYVWIERRRIIETDYKH
jgi:hypothetical protein